MPYKIGSPPDAIKGLPAKAQRIWINAFNSAYDDGKDEKTCFKIAWGAVANAGYSKNDEGVWMKNSKRDYREFLTEGSQAWRASDSDEGKRQRIQAALYLSGIIAGASETYIMLTFADSILVWNNLSQKYFMISYGDEGGQITFSDPVEVEPAYIPIDIQEGKIRRRMSECRVIRDLVDMFMGSWIIEQAEKSEEFLMSGPFIQDWLKNLNERYYTPKLTDLMIEKINKGGMVGYDGHPETKAPTPGETALKHLEAWKKEGIGSVRFKVLDTQKGRDIKIVAEEKIPVGLSPRGRGVEIWDDKRDAYRIDEETYEFCSLDAVVEPSLQKALALREQKEKTLTQAKEDAPMDELKKQIELLAEGLKAMKDEILGLKKQSETDAKAPGEVLAKVQAIEAKMKVDQEILEAKKHIETLLVADKLGEVIKFRDVLVRQLADCKTVAEADLRFESAKKIILEARGITDAKPQSVIITGEQPPDNGRNFWGGGVQRPKTIREAYERILARFPDTGDYTKYGKLDNPRWKAKTMLDNYLLFHSGVSIPNLESYDPSGEMLLKESRRNPLFWVTETAGDTETAAADVAATAGTYLPVLAIAMQQFITDIDRISAVQPIDRPAATAFFGKEYNLHSSADWDEVVDTFTDAGTDKETAEKGTPPTMKYSIGSTAIALKTPLKIISKWSREAEIYLRAYHQLDIGNVHLQMMKNEIMRGWTGKLLYSIMNDTSLAASDAIKYLAGSGFNFETSAPTGWTGEGWYKLGLSINMRKASSLMNKRPWSVRPDNWIYDGDLDYLWPEGVMAPNADAVNGQGIELGLLREGNLARNRGTLWSTDHSAYDKVVLGIHRGQSFINAAHIFLPFILFSIDPVIYVNDASSSQTICSYGTFAKVTGKKIVYFNVVEAEV